jgi:hypothetical protein
VKDVFGAEDHCKRIDLPLLTQTFHVSRRWREDDQLSGEIWMRRKIDFHFNAGLQFDDYRLRIKRLSRAIRSQCKHLVWRGDTGGPHDSPLRLPLREGATPRLMEFASPGPTIRMASPSTVTCSFPGTMGLLGRKSIRMRASPTSTTM